MKIILLPLLLILVSCGAKQIKHKKLNIHPDAQAYVASYEAKAGIKIDDLQVTYKALPAGQSNILGYCQTATQVKKVIKVNGTIEHHIYATPLVVLNSNYWNSSCFTKADKEELVYHELEHCIKKRGHSASRNSIMYPYHLGPGIYLANYSSLMNELFNRSNTAYVGYSFDSTIYASTYYPEFEEIEVEDLHESELKDCVHDAGHSIEEVHEGEHSHE